MYNAICRKYFQHNLDAKVEIDLLNLVQKFPKDKFGKFLDEVEISTYLNRYPTFLPTFSLPFMLSEHNRLIIIFAFGPLAGYISYIDQRDYGDETLPIFAHCEDFFSKIAKGSFDPLSLDENHTFPITIDYSEGAIYQERIENTCKLIRQSLAQATNLIYIQQLKLGLIWLSSVNDSADALSLLYDPDPKVVRYAINLLARRGKLSALRRIVEIIKESKTSKMIQKSNLDFEALLELDYNFHSKKAYPRKYLLRKLLKKYKSFLRGGSYGVADLYFEEFEEQL